MRIRLNYIFFFIIFVSLFGIGTDKSISITSFKYLKESEWIAKPNSNNKVLKCFHFPLKSFIISSDPLSQVWVKESCNYYTEKLIVLFVLQTRLFRKISITKLISIKRYIPRLFTDDNYVSFLNAEDIILFCFKDGISHQKGGSMWKHILNREWINQKRKININERSGLNGYPIGFS